MVVVYESETKIMFFLERGGHWLRKSNHIKSFATLQAVDALVKKEPEVPFMV